MNALAQSTPVEYSCIMKLGTHAILTLLSIKVVTVRVSVVHFSWDYG